MRSFILALGVKAQMVMQKGVALVRLFEFTKFLAKNMIFGQGNPKLILKVIKKFIELENYDYSDKIIMSRDRNASTSLISVLVDEYLSTNYNVTLEQLIEVLKTDFLKRDENGGKWK